MEVLNGKLTVFGGIQHRRGTMEEYDGENWIEIDKGLANQYFDGASVLCPVNEHDEKQIKILS